MVTIATTGAWITEEIWFPRYAQVILVTGIPNKYIVRSHDNTIQ